MTKIERERLEAQRSRTQHTTDELEEGRVDRPIIEPEVWEDADAARSDDR